MKTFKKKDKPKIYNHRISIRYKGHITLECNFRDLQNLVYERYGIDEKLGDWEISIRPIEADYE